MKTKTWDDDGTFCLEIGPALDEEDNIIEGEGWIDTGGKTIPQAVVDEIKQQFIVVKTDTFLIVMSIRSKGWHTPAQLCGPPEKCYPEEGEDVRTVEEMMVYPPAPEWSQGYSKEGKKLSQASMDLLEQSFSKEIEDLEIEHEEHHYED